ncbi:protein TESPA1-like isoform X2 [Myxocyprinus asiaticus]|uniref:protein TESPA1-like isoform X2 n=1 Tax=Myxocyprinus asiaticus TaxID=70543 RepID=UPI00222342A8|nr:protein TESPA1-like isoform X2 [Myxocyprinus asiaticus]
MESPSKIDRRQAWALSSRRKLTVREAEQRSSTVEDPHSHFSFQDDVFLDGYSAGKIETWLQGCGNEASSAKTRHLTIGALKTGTSFEDDLSLGAEALCAASDVPQYSKPQQKLNLPLFNMGHSVASTALSSTTNRTASSVSEVLKMRSEDAEETLFQLGFGCEEPQVTTRVPVRFFNFSSQLRGINFRLFLESQLSRVRQEDPCLSLASRFQQVEALTAMANAFYSLYSHVSRTPLQKLAPPQFTFSSLFVERIMSRTSVRSEPRSPVERLKDTISKMCLYTGSHGSDSVSPSSSPHKQNCSLSHAVEKGGESSGNDDASKQDTNLCHQMELGDLDSDMDWYIRGKKDLEEACEVKTERMDSERVTDTTSEPTQHSRSDIVMESKGCTSVHLKSSSVTVEPVPIITHDIICPQVVEYINQAPYRCLQTNNMDASDLPFAQQVHSAEEEEAISSELCSTVTSSVSTQQYKSSSLRGDSFQSDSSGYVEEDVQHSPLHR